MALADGLPLADTALYLGMTFYLLASASALADSDARPEAAAPACSAHCATCAGCAPMGTLPAKEEKKKSGRHGFLKPPPCPDIPQRSAPCRGYGGYANMEREQKKKFYITTPIYYPSDKLHIGHTYCTVATDAMARYKRLQGYDVMFLTGTDEHGQKIEDKAKEAGVTPQEFVDRIVTGEKGVLDLWKLMNISNDRFIRTTDDYHVSAIQKIFKKMYENGDIYKGKYVGKYCKPCESFWTESQLVDGKCPDCGRPVQDAEEEAYFFRLSKYADKVQDLLENTDFLQPRSRVHEMVNNFIKPGLEDLCVSPDLLLLGGARGL